MVISSYTRRLLRYSIIRFFHRNTFVFPSNFGAFYNRLLNVLARFWSSLSAVAAVSVPVWRRDSTSADSRFSAALPSVPAGGLAGCGSRVGCLSGDGADAPLEAASLS